MRQVNSLRPENAQRLWRSRELRDHSRYSRRAAFTLLELVATLLSATVLLAGLASTVAVALSLLDVPETQSHDALTREIRDRMAMDLRYATSLTHPNSSTITLQRTGPVTALPEQVTYAFRNTGLSRQVNSNSSAALDTVPAGYVATADSYALPTMTPEKSTCLISVSKAASSGSTNSLAVTMPPGCSQGDLLLLCVSGRFASSNINVPGGWSTIRDVSRSPIRQVVLYRYCRANENSSVSMNSSTSSPMAAVLLAFSSAHPWTPVSYSNTDTGYSFVAFGTPSVLQPSTSSASRMLVQFVAAEGDQWPASTFGLASFVDTAHVLASPSSNSVSLGASLRHGIYPSLSTTPRVYFAGLGRWVHTAVEIDVAP